MFLIALPLYAGPLYEWKDENGKWHFTDRLNEVPKKYLYIEKRERFLRWKKEKPKIEKTEEDTKESEDKKDSIESKPPSTFSGVKKEYYPNGKLKTETNYVNGIKEGITKDYYKNGQLRGEANFLNGKREGIYKWYYKNGQLESEAYYKNGKPEGIGKTYYESGGIAFIDTFKNGQKINREAYDENGKLVK